MASGAPSNLCLWQLWSSVEKWIFCCKYGCRMQWQAEILTTHCSCFLSEQELCRGLWYCNMPYTSLLKHIRMEWVGDIFKPAQQLFKNTPQWALGSRSVCNAIIIWCHYTAFNVWILEQHIELAICFSVHKFCWLVLCVVCRCAISVSNSTSGQSTYFSTNSVGIHCWLTISLNYFVVVERS